MQRLRTTCCVAGGGPAGIMVGYLLARAGVETLVLEKHKDFLRDFRGDTVHPSTLDVIAELGLLEQFLRLPHQEVRLLRGQIGDTLLTIGDFTHIGTRCKFVALMPQWHFLSFLAEEGSKWPAFQLRMCTEVTDLLVAPGGRVTGVRAASAEGPLEVEADLVIAADGRHSGVRARAGLQVQDLGSPIDVLWLRLSRQPEDSLETLGYFNHGRVMVTLDRGDYWQCAFVIRKGELQDLRQRGIESLREQIVRIVPKFRGRVMELQSWDDVKLLTVRVDRLRQWWKPGLLCIGDAAHAMSPIGGVGINLAIQDAVAAANILARPLHNREVREEHLAAVQRRRTFPTRLTQSLQILIHEHVINRVLASEDTVEPPWQVKLFDWIPALRRIPARVVGVGVRPEHVRNGPGAFAGAPR
jgi:2-polyprenyl-6-methoxyphenol hydroxylase-like FAD-dependent oxidoreductase